MTTSGLRTGEYLDTAIGSLANDLPYRPHTSPLVDDGPYHRPLDASRLANVDWTRPLTESQFVSDESLLAHRVLMNVYESDALFLPVDGLRGKERSFEAFYSSRNRQLADQVRPGVEDFALGFLDKSVRVNGSWDEESTLAHLETTIDEAVNAERPVLDAIEKAPDTRRAAGMLIVQMALDGLTEATAMSQNLGGAFGPEQSELFKIFIDEFGYGVFGAKHSTLFADLCASTGMETRPHHYWFFYLPSSIAVNNYFYWVTRNRTGFFRYIGAMALLEATFAPWFAQLGKTLRNVYGESVDARYCDEHAHIDQHHGRMAVHDLLLPLARKHGPVAAAGLIRGVEEIRWLSARADDDLLAQLSWAPAVEAGPGPDTEGAQIRRLGAETPFETMVAPHDLVLTVLSGEAALHWTGTGDPLAVGAGQSVRVPKGRLYGLQSTSDTAVAVRAAR